MSSSNTLGSVSLSRLLYTHNPFYLISALLVLVGLHKALSTPSSSATGWLLLGVLCSYTLLLVLAGYVIVRFGQVWEDARMILLVIVLMFVALSIGFDRLVLDNPARGTRFLLAGWAFALLVSESVFRSLQINLTRRYRLPFYLVLTLLFAYPGLLAWLSVEGRDTAMSWGVFLFPLAASAVLLSLWPASRSRGADEPASGTPWTWPWFPWSLFVFLAVAIALRSYSLSMAFEASKGSAVSFRPYFLSPLILTASLLLLEVALANGSRRARQIALVLPAAVLVLSFPGSELNPVALRFLHLLAGSIGSPAQIALTGLSVFYAIAWQRGMKAAEAGLMGCAALACVVGRQSVDWGSLTPIQAWPLGVLAALQLPWGLWRRSCWRTSVGIVASFAALQASGWWPHLSRYALGHDLVIAVLLVAAVFDDRAARVMRRAALLLIPLTALMAATTYEWFFPAVPWAYHALYLVALTIVGLLYWRRRPDMPHLLSALATAGCLVLIGSRGAYFALEPSPLARGLPWIAGGMTALGVALLVSCVKGGLLSRGWSLLRSLNQV